MDSKTFFDNFEIIANAPGGIARLRELILDLAVKGKLVEQDSKIETIEFDWDIESLRLDQQKLWGQDSLEIPPEHWLRIPMAALGRWGSGGTPTRGNKSYYGGSIPWLVIGDLNDGLVLSAENHITEKGLQNSSASIVPKGAVFVAMYGSIGKSGIAGIECATNQAIAHCIPHLEIISTEYLFRLVLAIRAKLFRQGRGLAQQNISQTILKHLMVALPPIGEQQRIVAKVDELMTLCDELEASQNYRNSVRTAARKSAIDAISTATTPEELDVAWKRISSNWTTIADTPASISSLRSLILDLAVRGSLDSSELGANQAPINVEFEKLKLDDEKLWRLSTALPEPVQGWSRVPMARLGQWGSGGTPTASRKEYYSNGTIPWAVIGDLNNSVMLTTESMITQKALEASSTKMIPVGAVLVAMYGASIGKSAISGIECCTNQAIAHCVVDQDVITPEYLFLVIKSLKVHLIEMGKGAAQPNISQSVLKHLVIDIPPLSIQKRVIERTDELLDLCNQLELSLIKRDEISKKIVGSLVNEVAA